MAEDVQVSIGGNITPFQTAMAEVKVQAESAGKSVGQIFGVEGFKGERALHTQITGFFKDISSGADVGTAAMSHLQESFKMGAAGLVAFAAVQYLGEALQKGYEGAKKFSAAVQESLGITSNTTNKSLEQVQAEIEKLKASVKDTDLESMTNLQAGATVLVQALEDGKTVSEQINEDAQAHFDLVKKLHDEQDNAATETIDAENEILQLKIAGNDAQADALKDEIDDQKKLLELQRQGDSDAIAALQTQIDLKKQLRDAAENKKEAKESDDLNSQLAAEKARQREIGLTAEQKLAAASAKVQADRDAIAKATAASRPASEQDIVNQLFADDLNGTSDKTRAIDATKAELALQKDITAQKQLQAEVDSKNDEANKSATDREADQIKNAVARRAELQGEISEVGLTGEQKAAALRQKIQEETAAFQNFRGPRQQSEILRDQNQILTDQLALKRQIAENDRAAAEKAAEARRRMEEHIGFHGPVSSLRRVGFGSAPGAASDGGTHHTMDELVASASSLAAAGDSSHHTISSLFGRPLSLPSFSGSQHQEKVGSKLDGIHGQLVQLNQKIGGAA